MALSVMEENVAYAATSRLRQQPQFFIEELITLKCHDFKYRFKPEKHFFLESSPITSMYYKSSCSYLYAACMRVCVRAHA